MAATKVKDFVRLTWSPPATDGGSPVTAYRIYRGLAPGQEEFRAEVSGATLTFDDRTATARRIRYYYVVTAVNAVDEGPPSNEVDIRR